MASVLNAREYVESLHRAGHMHAVELLDAIDAADDVYAIADEFGELAPDVSLQDEARRLVVFEWRVRELLTEPAPPPDNWYDVGWQHFLIGKHMPDRMAHQYPTQDRFTPGDETQFIAGWHAAKAADDLAKAEAATYGTNRYD